MTARYCSRSVGTGMAAKRRGILGIVEWNGTVQLLNSDILNERHDL